MFVYYPFYCIWYFAIFALGPLLKVAGRITSLHLPYYYFYQIFTPAQGVRVPARLSVLFNLFVGALAAYGMLILEEKVKSRSYKFIFWAVIVCIVLVELYSVNPMTYEIKDRSNDLVISYIREKKEIGPIIQLPMAKSGESFATIAMYNSTLYNKPIFNGYSGFKPDSYEKLQNYFIENLPSDDSLTLLTNMGINYILVDKSVQKSAVEVNGSDKITKILESEEFILYKAEGGGKVVLGDYELGAKIDGVDNFHREKIIKYSYTFKNPTDSLWISPEIKNLPITRPLRIKCKNQVVYQGKIEVMPFLTANEEYSINKNISGISCEQANLSIELE